MRELTNEKNYNCLNYGYIIIAPIQTMAESVTQTGTIIEPLEQNIEQIIDEITSEPRPINSDAIQNVKEYISEYFGNLGYDNIEYQKFEYNDENNENAIDRKSTRLNSSHVKRSRMPSSA